MDDTNDLQARAASAVRLAAVVTGAVIALWPVTVRLFGSDVSCGGSAVAFARSLSAHASAPGSEVAELTQACGAAAWPHLLVALVVVVGGLAVGWRLAPTASQGRSFRLIR